ncbi:MAG TPA: hypothetical protein VFR82_10110 [Nitrospira sp.]|nr:hypothetical protein [Nitrospira sp.]
MQTLDLHRPHMPDLQFVLLVTALCTSRLPALNVPDGLRTTIFDRCWMLIHDCPPPRKPEERVLDLRPWSEMTVEAMVETIRVTLIEAGIETLTWDHPSSEPTRTSPPEAQMLIDRLERLYPHPSEGKDAPRGETLETTGVHPDPVENEVGQLIGEMATLMAALAPAMKRRAADLAAEGKADEVVDKLLKGAEVMHGSGHMYLTWARHYASLSENSGEEAQET